VSGLRRTQFIEPADQPGNDLTPVADDSVAGLAEDIGFLVLVDRDDVAGAVAAGHVLAGARDGDGEVEVRANDLSGQPDLPTDGLPAVVADGP
jgi:hypothetical protein